MSSNPTAEDAGAILAALAESFFATSAEFVPPSAPLSEKESRDGYGPNYEARYNALIEHIPGVIFVAPMDLGKGDAYVSPQVETILGFTQEEWLEDPIRWYQQVHPEDKERWSIEAASLFLSGQPLSSTYRVMARDGRVVWFQCDARMIHSSDGKPSFIHGIGFDITKLKKAEASLQLAHDQLETRVTERTQALEQANAQLKTEIAGHQRTELLLIAAKDAAEASARVKSEFVANMSHEIRTPMNGVIGMTNLVLNTELTQLQRDHLNAVRSSAESLLTVINQVLDFSKLESGKFELDHAAFNLRDSIRVLIGELTYSATQKGLELDCHISPDCTDSVSGDLGRLRQVLTNLIGNAIKFTHKGRVILKIEAGDKRTTSCVLRFSVSDTGIGIPDDKIVEIFEPFVQSDGSITRKYGGTGLGLAISRELVTRMGGRLEVASAPIAGSVFSFTAVFQVTQRKAAVLQLDKAAEKEAHSEEKRVLSILVAEDNLVNQMVVTGILEHCGHAVTIANDGREALLALSKAQFDLVLMDIQMPVMDGISATEAIRAEESSGSSHIPIIGLSAHAQEADRIRAMQSGMDGYVSKPFKGTELMLLIKELTCLDDSPSGPQKVTCLV